VSLDLAQFEAGLAAAPAPGRYCLAYSGGLDSHVLVHLAARLRAEIPRRYEFVVYHVHHGLNVNADAWAEHCRRICRDLGLTCHVLRVNARPRPGQSPEEAARDARYRALEAIVGTGGVLLTAQHLDDQAETVLLQLLRGAGLSGLAAMPASAPFGAGSLLRPLLRHTRRELQDYAEHQGLEWIEDTSNTDLSFDRNFIRHQVFPLLRRRWPALATTLSRSAAHCAEASDRLDRLAHDLHQAVRDPDGLTLNVSRLRRLDAVDRRAVLRRWLRERGFRMPAKAIAERVASEVLEARDDKMPVVAWPEGEVRRYRDRLYALPPGKPFDAGVRLHWDRSNALPLPDGNGELRIEPSLEGGLARAAWESARTIEVRYRAGGETCYLPGRAGGHALKKLLQEAGVPPWERSRLPLIYLDDRLAAVADRWVCALYDAASGQAAVSIRWSRE